MEAQILQSIGAFQLVDSEKLLRKPSGFIQVSQRIKETNGVRMFMMVQSNRRTSIHLKPRLKFSSSLNNSAVQGEVIEQSFGEEHLCFRTLQRFTAAALEHGMHPPISSKPEWRALSNELVVIATEKYRPRFVDYFRLATPETTLGSIKFESHPSKRKPSGGIESLRAIPWIFAWTQTRFHLPMWLGFGAAFKHAIQKDIKNLSMLEQMYKQWPFFRLTVDLVEMVFAKGDPSIAALYDKLLVSEEQPFGDRLRQDYEETKKLLLQERYIVEEVEKISHKKLIASGSMLVSGGSPASLDESLILKHKAAEVEQYLNGRCIYLVGMMGSGKTTVGRVLSDALNYSFCDSDLLVEQNMGGISVAEIFNQHGEGLFRDKESDALKELSMRNRLVISTGGGAVIRPINWKHMRKGVSVWLDVPLECLARRISAVGTNSRPLLHGDSGDAYSKALTRLSTLLEKRGEAYANANARVSFEYIAMKLGHVNVDNLTPGVIALEALEQIESFLKDDDFAV